MASDLTAPQATEQDFGMLGMEIVGWRSGLVRRDMLATRQWWRPLNQEIPSTNKPSTNFEIDTTLSPEWQAENL